MPYAIGEPSTYRPPATPARKAPRSLIYWPGKPRDGGSFMPDEAVPSMCRDRCILSFRAPNRYTGDLLGVKFGHRLPSGTEFFDIEPHMLRTTDLDLWGVIKAWIADLHDGAQP